MKLSVIIVNYNVKFFLEQCLKSVLKASEQLSLHNPLFTTEIFVVDNNSVDSSTQMLKDTFPSVKLIENKDNKGFSVANNQALRQAKGEYQLLLNPDTVIEEQTFCKVVAFMDSHPDAGGLGVKMIDGAGVFLPESKRGLPKPRTAFYKIFGLSALFPKSKRFGKYHLGYLDKNETHSVDVLSGAFMLLRKNVLDQIGLLDESFFMYGEDIDLSYRIIKAGYKNYYFPQTHIIHYKGESTKKSSVNYVFTFYRAMIIFAKKHFSSKNASLFSLLINLAIYFRASVSIVKRFFEKAFLPVADFLFIFGGLNLVKMFWENNAQYGHGRPYPKELVFYIFPIYILIWMLSLLSTKAYNRPFSKNRILKGVLLGSLVISAFYAFFEESFRFSRAIIILGTFSTFIASYLTRILVTSFHVKKPVFHFDNETRIVIVGNSEEATRVSNLLSKSNLSYTLIGFVYPVQTETKEVGFIGNILQIDEIVRIHKISEIIFCAKDLPSSEIIKTMSLLDYKDVAYKIAPDESYFIIGSHSKNDTGDLYTIDIRLQLALKKNKTKKRLFDFAASSVSILFSPILILFQENKKCFWTNMWHVLYGKKSLVGYYSSENVKNLPQLKNAILQTDLLQKKSVEISDYDALNLHYARDYSLQKDLIIYFRGINKLGN
jgi:GT2 family glycosyltransferase